MSCDLPTVKLRPWLFPSSLLKTHLTTTYFCRHRKPIDLNEEQRQNNPALSDYRQNSSQRENWLPFGRYWLPCLYFGYINERIATKSKHPLHSDISTRRSSLTVHCLLELPLSAPVQFLPSHTHSRPAYLRGIYDLTLTATQHYTHGCLIYTESFRVYLPISNGSSTIFSY